MRRDYYKVMDDTLRIFRNLFFYSSILSAFVIRYFPNSPEMLLTIAIMSFFFVKKQSIIPLCISLSTISLIFFNITASIGYAIGIAYFATSVFMLLFQQSAIHYELKFSCIKTYLAISTCFCIFFVPISLLLSFTLVQSIFASVFTLVISAFLVTSASKLISSTTADSESIFLTITYGRLI